MTSPCKHVWVSLQTTPMETRCLVCGILQPKPQRVVRLVVLNRRVSCPLGWNESDGSRDLHNCYLDSITPGHRCVDPERTGAKRCPHIAKFHRRYGWRTFYRTVQVEYVRYGVLHERPVMQIHYSPLNREGTKWYAWNAATGQRFELVLDGSKHQWSWNADTKQWLGVLRGSTRRTPEGDDLEQEYRSGVLLNNTGVARFRESGPIWSGVMPRQDRLMCNCINCQEHRRAKGTTVSVQEFERFRGIHISGPRPDKPPVKPADLPSAQPVPGDPATCMDCKFARCTRHRMTFRPVNPHVVVPGATTPMVDLRTGKTGTLAALLSSGPSAREDAMTLAPARTRERRISDDDSDEIMSKARHLTSKMTSVTAEVSKKKESKKKKKKADKKTEKKSKKENKKKETSSSK